MGEDPSFDMAEGSVEQRRFIRRTVFFDAALEWRGQGRVPCKVRDFCRGGMFLSWAEDATHPPLQRGDQLQIHISLPNLGTEHSLPAEVARVLTSGVGVAFGPEVDEAALAPLEAQAVSNTQPRPGGAQHSDAAQLVIPVREISNRHFKLMVDKFLKRADERLFLAARDAGNDVEQREYFDSMNLLKQKTDDMAKDMCATLSEYLNNLGGSVDMLEEGGASQGLSLLEIDEFEELLMIGAIVSKSEPTYKEQLWRLENRLARLASGDLDRSNNPIAPASVCRIISDSIGVLELPPSHVRQMYEIVEELIIPALGPWYAELEDELDRAGLTVEEVSAKPTPPPPKRPTPKRPPPVQSEQVDAPPVLEEGGEGFPPLNETPPPAPEAYPQSAPDAAPGAQPSAADFSHQAPAGADAGAGVAPIPAGPQAAPAGPTPAPGVAAPAQSAPPVNVAGTPSQAPVAAAGTGQLPVTGAPASAAPPPVYSGAPPPVAASGNVSTGPTASATSSAASAPSAYAMGGAGGQYQAARNLMGIRRGISSGAARVPVARADASGQVSAPVFSNTDILNAIQSLEAEDAGPWGEETSGSEFYSRLESVLSSRDGEKAVNETQADALSMASGLSRALGSDELLPERVRPMFKRLQGTLHKLAVADENFLSDESHPARQLINKLAEVDLEGTLSAEDLILQEKLEALIDKLRNYDGDPQIFQQAIEELDALTESRSARFRENMRDVVRECEEREKSEKKSGRAKPDRSSDKKVSPEWAIWLDKARRLRVGDTVQLKRSNQAAQRVALAWVGEDFSQFVFVNSQGERAASMTLQELAMQLRRGTVTVLERSDLPVVERAIFSTLYQIHDQVGQEALHDTLTGLVNRKKFVRELEKSLVAAGSGEIQAGAILICLDGTEALAEHAGEKVRQSLIRKVANLINDSLRDENFVLARVAEQDFGLLLHEVSDQDLERIGQQLLKLVRKIKVKFKEENFPLTASVGMLNLSEEVSGLDQAMRMLEASVMEAQSAGGDALREVSGDDPALADSVDWAGWLSTTLENEEITLIARRIVAIDQSVEEPGYTEILAGVEEDGQYRTLPDDFGTAKDFEDSIRQLDQLVIAKTMQWMARNGAKLAELGGCGINLSLHSVTDPGLMDFVLAQLTESMVPPGQIIFEISESTAVANLDEVERFMRTLSEFGCRFVLDRFGGTDTSQGYLNKLPADFIKIDEMFVNDLDSQSADLALVKSINEIGRLTGKQSIAAGVDSESVAKQLEAVGVPWMQGVFAGGLKQMDALADG